MLKRFLLLSPFLLSGCVLIGGGAYQTMDTISTGATAVSYGTTGKGITDHAISKIVGKDCRMFNVLKKKQICRIHKTYEVNFYSGLKNTYLITEETPNVTKLDTRHKRYAHKVWGKRSNLKVECKSSGRVFRIQDPILARRTGRNETCSKK